MTEPLHYLSATEALAAFRARELSPVELLDAVIARAEAMEPTVNALCHTYYDEAREQARAAEARYAGRGEAPRALEGLPVAIKAEEAIEGHPWSQGSEIHRTPSPPTPRSSPAAISRPGRSCTRARPTRSSRAPGSPTRACGA